MKSKSKPASFNSSCIDNSKSNSVAASAASDRVAAAVESVSVPKVTLPVEQDTTAPRFMPALVPKSQPVGTGSPKKPILFLMDGIPDDSVGGSIEDSCSFKLGWGRSAGSSSNCANTERQKYNAACFELYHASEN